MRRRRHVGGPSGEPGQALGETLGRVTGHRQSVVERELEAGFEVPGARGAQLRFEELPHRLGVGHRSPKLDLERAAVAGLVPAQERDHLLRAPRRTDAAQQPEGVPRLEHPNRQHADPLDAPTTRLLPDLDQRVLEHAFRRQRVRSRFVTVLSFVAVPGLVDTPGPGNR